MAFKVQRVSKVKAPPVLPGSSNLDSSKDHHSKLKGSADKPRVPGGKPHVERSSPGSAKPSATNQDQNSSRDQRIYCYAGVEFRPLHVTDKEAVSTVVVPEISDSSSKQADIPREREILAYEEVQIPAGNFDKVNPESILVKSHQPGGGNSTLAAFTSDMQHLTQACRDDGWSTHQAVKPHLSGKKPPPMPKPYSKTKDSVDAPDAGKKKMPPPMPKPYNSRKEGVEEPSHAQGALDAVYAVVNKSSQPKTAMEMRQNNADEVESETPPPLPSRPDFEAEGDLRKSQEDLVNEDPKEVLEKSTKGLGIMKTFKKHIRQASDGGQSPKKADEVKGVSDNATTPSEEHSNGNKKSEPIKAYLVTDIVNQPSTKMFGEPEMYEAVTDLHDEGDWSSGSTDLPEGWQQVKDSGETYYWHVASGTTQWEKPRRLENTSNKENHHSHNDQSKPKPKPELKTVTSFPVHSMGWLELEESQVAPHNMSDTIAECISNLARQRKDLWTTAETWGEGKDLRLLLESDNLKLVEVQSKATLLVQPISKMRVWGAGREELKDFAYVARDQATGKHKCHVFRCHGAISGRAIHNKLHEMCNKILAEKKKAREHQQENAPSKQWSDILNTPPKACLKDQAGFNVKPVPESKKSFSAKHVGKVEVPRPKGIDVLNRAVGMAVNCGDPHKWRTCLIEITISNVRATDCMSQQVIAEDRIKFVSFIGVAKDVRFCGYITSLDHNSRFMCHVFQCIPNAASFTKALEEACRLRLQSCLDTNPELAQKLVTTEADKVPGKEPKPTAGIKGFLGKLANPSKLGGKKSSSESGQDNSNSPDRDRSTEVRAASGPSLIKYYGHYPVSVGTGPNAIREAVKAAQGTSLQISTITIAPESITLDDSIKSGMSRKLIRSERISYCGLASDRVHFGVVESQGGGKFICHVFSEYKIPVNTMVEAINRML